METTSIGTRSVSWRAKAKRTIHVPRRSALPHPGEVVQNFGQVAAGVTAVRVASRWYRKRTESKVEETNEREKWAKLLVSIAVDVVGWSSFVLPGVGEVEDVVWAPVSAAMVQALYGNRLLTGIDFVKEALPFTDVLPTATVGWAIQYTPLGNFVPTNRKEAKKKRKPGEGKKTD
mmetsp:Transcript_7379/g.26261  ORF Transcript_7379/g.26261 Transcript_7379/m.26261 type:complete len:175 (+) Transcript_7379:28-552(+)